MERKTRREGGFLIKEAGYYTFVMTDLTETFCS